MSKNENENYIDPFGCSAVLLEAILAEYNSIPPVTKEDASSSVDVRDAQGPS
jgi:hypothetical protein